MEAICHIFWLPSISIENPCFSIEKPAITIEKHSFLMWNTNLDQKTKYTYTEKPSFSIENFPSRARKSYVYAASVNSTVDGKTTCPATCLSSHFLYSWQIVTWRPLEIPAIVSLQHWVIRDVEWDLQHF